MKNLFKVFGIIAIVAIIGFSMVACGDDGGGGGEGGGLAGTRWQGTNEGLAPGQNYSLRFTASKYSAHIMDIDTPFVEDTYEFDSKSGTGTLFRYYTNSNGDNAHFTVVGNKLTQDDVLVYHKK